MDWAKVAGIASLAAAAASSLTFFAVVWGTLRRRIVWLWRPAYEVTHLELPPDGGVTVTMIARNPRREPTHLFDFRMRARNLPGLVGAQGLAGGWVEAEYNPQDAATTVMAVPPDGMVHQPRVRLARYWPDANDPFPRLHSNEEESRISKAVVLLGANLEFFVGIGTENITLHGQSTGGTAHAVERPSLLRRLGRVF